MSYKMVTSKALSNFFFKITDKRWIFMLMLVSDCMIMFDWIHMHSLHPHVFSVYIGQNLSDRWIVEYTTTYDAKNSRLSMYKRIYSEFYKILGN